MCDPLERCADFRRAARVQRGRRCWPELFRRVRDAIEQRRAAGDHLRRRRLDRRQRRTARRPGRRPSASARDSSLAQLRPPGGRAGRAAHAPGDVVLLMDSDMQDAPEALERFLLQWQAGYDVVYAVRRDRPERFGSGSCSPAFTASLAAIADTHVPTDAGNFSLIDARVVDEIVRLGERDRYLPGLRSWVGFRQIGIEVRRLPRYDDKPRVSLRGLWRLAKTAIFSFSTFPLFVFTLIGYSALGRVRRRWRAFRCSAGCLPAWRFPAGRRRADGQLLRRGQCTGHQHAGRIRDAHLRPGARPAVVPGGSGGQRPAKAKRSPSSPLPKRTWPTSNC